MDGDESDGGKQTPEVGAPVGVRPLSSVIKTLALIDQLAGYERAVRLAELVRQRGTNRSTVYQRLITLVAAGWVEQVEQGAFRLSLHAARIGEAALQQASLGERSVEVLRELSLLTGESATLAIMSGLHVRVIRRVESESTVKADVKTNSLLSLSESSSGRILTAFAPAGYRAILRDSGAKLACEESLQEVARDGYAVSSGKDVPGIQSVAAPVMNSTGCIAAMAVVVPASRFRPVLLVEPLKAAAGRLSAIISGKDATTA